MNHGYWGLPPTSGRIVGGMEGVSFSCWSVVNSRLLGIFPFILGLIIGSKVYCMIFTTQLCTRVSKNEYLHSCVFNDLISGLRCRGMITLCV